MKNKELLINYEKATQELVDFFVKKYFKNDASDVYWVADEIGGVLCVNDYFFSIDRIVEAIKLNCSSKKLFDYYDKETLFNFNKKNDFLISFRAYVKYGDKILNK